MIPQENFVVVAPVKTDRPDRIADLRALLATLNFSGKTGFADPGNQRVPFGAFPTIHYARFVVLADNTLADRAHYPVLTEDKQEKEEKEKEKEKEKETPPTYLCFMVDCDGDATALMETIGQRAKAGLEEIFVHCKGFDEGDDPLDFMRDHRIYPRTSYVNWVGRTVEQIKDEATLHALLRDALSRTSARDPQCLRTELLELVPNFPLRDIPPTPFSWRLRKLVHMLVPIVLALLATLLAFWVACMAIVACWHLIGKWTILAVPVALALLFLLVAQLLVVLRDHEQADPIIDQPTDVRNLRDYEDHDVSNQYTAMGSLKPGRFRLYLEIAILYALNWAARHICTRGSLGRISTIHFAHWSPFLDNNSRAFFCSNYDGGHEAYMDDFINKAGFGLNFSFSSAIAYPVTAWLFAKGAWLEQEFKRFQRHHQIPTDVWYKAYPGLTAQDLARNSRIRNGYEKPAMSDDEIRRWVAEI